MKLYCHTYIDDERAAGEAHRAAWYGTQVEWNRDRKRLRNEGMRNITPHLVEVPTAKAALLQFLNDREVRP